ncbi:MAG TPA: hypothetical protein VIS72_09155, partial [Anaerolineales bacterium]
QASVNIRIELDQPSLSMEPLAGLVAVHLAGNDIASASFFAEQILEFLDKGSNLEGVEEPLRVYHTCYLYLEKKKDPRSLHVIQQAKKALEEQVSKFSAESDRKRYIENIPWRRAIWEAEVVQSERTSV